jgi:hypothetical protein
VTLPTVTELVVPEYLLDLRTGEQLAPTADNAAELIGRLREYRREAMTAIQACEAILIEASRIAGTKTLHLEGATATVYGGPQTDYDLETLAKLREHGLPEERWNALVKETVSYKVDGRVIKQLEGSGNPNYAAVIRNARRVSEAPYRVKVA